MQSGGQALRTRRPQDAYAERAVRFDPDIWIVEIDDPQGRHSSSQSR